MTDPHDGHGSAGLTLMTGLPGGGLLTQTWTICACSADELRTHLGEPDQESMATGDQVRAIGQAAKDVPGVTHLL